MNKYLLRNFLYAICMVALLTACDDNDDYDRPEMNGTYSNKLSAPEGGDALILTYSGREFVGKDVAFKMTNDNTANITLHGVLPGETHFRDQRLFFCRERNRNQWNDLCLQRESGEGENDTGSD